MEYLVTTLRGNDREIISRHSSLQEAMEAGEKIWNEVPKGVIVSCISGTLDEAGKLTGRYLLYNSWF